VDRKFSSAETEKLIQRAQKQFKSFIDWEGAFRQSFEEDVRFANGDADNQWQWDGEVLQNRKDCPSMTINMTWIHCALVQNEIKRNPPSIMVRPVGGGATAKSAEVYGGLIREIQRASDALNIYLKASEPLVQGGVGYWRVLTEYEAEDSFDQVIRIRSVRSPLGVAMDPDAKEPSGADANWGMIFEDIKNEYLEEEHVKYKDSVGAENAITINVAAADWKNEDYTRVAEWYEKEKFQDQLLGFTDPDSQQFATAFLSDIKDDEIKKKVLSDVRTQKRPVNRSRICWYKIFGDKIVDYREVPGKKYIPIVRVVGQETIIDGNLDRKGIVRSLKDTQRNLNYWVSAGAMQVALQTNVPWVGPAAAFENIKQWEDGNRGRYAYLPFNHLDDNGEPIPAPTRPGPPIMAPAYISGIQIASQQFKDISGQHENLQGQEDNAVSGKAIKARQGQGETATYHFPNALAQGVAHTGRIILDMAPEVYDTPRMIRISNVDMTQSDVNVDPMAKTDHAEIEKPGEENTTEVTWNPKIGRFEVEAETGPSYQTQREWTADALGSLLAQNKELWQVIGDFYADNLDFPGSEQMAERIRRTMSPAVLGKGPSPNEQKLQQQLQQGQQLMQSLMDTLAKKQKELDDKDDEIAIKAEAEVTRRMDAISRRLKEAGNAQANFASAGLEPDIKNIMSDVTAEAMNEDLHATLEARKPQPENATGEQPEMAQ
jgi:hypothetical protein